jgi:3',5'-cyclic AMP phosphodiesterase CpdA
VVAGQPHGAVCGARLARLEALLAQAPLTPTVLAMHHPPFPTFIGHMDQIGLREGAQELARLVERHPQVERVICGHLHRSIQVRWANTVALTAPSTAHQVTLDLNLDAPSTYTMEPAGFLLHAWQPGSGFVTHQVTLGDWDGPHPFHADGALID